MEAAGRQLADRVRDRRSRTADVGSRQVAITARPAPLVRCTRTAAAATIRVGPLQIIDHHQQRAGRGGLGGDVANHRQPEPRGLSVFTCRSKPRARGTNGDHPTRGSAPPPLRGALAVPAATAERWRTVSLQHDTTPLGAEPFRPLHEPTGTCPRRAPPTRAPPGQGPGTALHRLECCCERRSPTDERPLEPVPRPARGGAGGVHLGVMRRRPLVHSGLHQLPDVLGPGETLQRMSPRSVSRSPSGRWSTTNSAVDWATYTSPPPASARSLAARLTAMP